MSFLIQLQERLGLTPKQVAANAIRDMFLSKQYNGKVPTADLEKIFTNPQWIRSYGRQALQNAWNEIYDEGYVERDMTQDIWKWIGVEHEPSKTTSMQNPIAGHGETYGGNIGVVPFRGRGTGMM